MPNKYPLKVPPNNKKWDRGGRLNEKHSVEMTTEELASVAACEGIKHEHTCKNPVFYCPECGNYGCTQDVAEKCSVQGFKGDKCLHCGYVGTRIPVMKEDYAEIKAAWEKETISSELVPSKE